MKSGRSLWTTPAWQRGMRIRVESQRNDLGVPTPMRIQFDDRRIDVAEVCDRWDGRTYRYFKVVGDDASLYIVRYDELQDAWDLTLFDSRRETNTPEPRTRENDATEDDEG